MKNRWTRGVRGVLAALVVLCVPISSAMAMRVSPMVVEMETNGGSAVARVEVQNVNQGNLAFETRIFQVTFDENGEVVETPADDKFLVFPPQGVLPAGGRQVVRLQWVGAPDLATSESFYVSVNQLPVQLEPTVANEATAQLQVVYNMRALVVVSPPGATPNVEAASVVPIEYQAPAETAGEAPPALSPGLAVTLRNTGRRHAMMSEFGWRIEGTDTRGEPLRLDISREELNRAIGTGYVPPLGERTFRFPVAAAFGPQAIKLSFTR